jgi:hypothetical protein
VAGLIGESTGAVGKCHGGQDQGSKRPLLEWLQAVALYASQYQGFRGGVDMLFLLEETTCWDQSAVRRGTE